MIFFSFERKHRAEINQTRDHKPALPQENPEFSDVRQVIRPGGGGESIRLFDGEPALSDVNPIRKTGGLSVSLPTPCEKRVFFSQMNPLAHFWVTGVIF
jgi:hypothetical protein